MFWISIDRSLDTSLIRQVYEQIRIRILHGELQKGERLPSTRELSSSLQISRNVIIEAYEQLVAEGYIVGQQGSGMYVAEGAYLGQQQKEEYLSFFETNNLPEEKNIEMIDFRSGIPALNLFPRKTWGQMAKQVYIETSHSIFGYDHPEGRIELRHVLSRYLKRTRGVHCHPDQLVVTTGATQALYLVAHLLLSPNDEVILEDPITHEIQKIFKSRGSSLYPIPVDEFGMKTSLLPSDKKPSFIFVTPSHQFPIGGILPIQRRIQLIQFARKTNCYIVEDDYDSEFRYQGTPVSSLQGLDPDRVIYIGTFSKILSPALRLGYLILPPSLINRCKDLRWFMDLHTPSPEQITLARFIDDRHLEHHIRKMKKVYKGRRDHLKACLKNNFRDNIRILGDSTGLHLVAEFKNVNFSKQMLAKIEKKQVKVYPVELHTMKKGCHQSKIILGYGNLTKGEIEEGVLRLKDVLATKIL
ncbi:PLP-dependent aminotransferase family protein [Bacillus sp. CLL-7-23]|uniref:PLP-dependent aminotransferase family protein n=1 Tax=Bacillus changyiensis TaxID=3004103 RepID=A0ABT4X830_9BACI|nr:PLP-dependent aminotransferase family protein [Bacillus changyiensis]MDA7028429.1 PLP-dependent aminotransferase family protein [Bacillus changyiensis]